MLIFKKKLKPVYFIHIPRTGGRFLRELLSVNNYTLNFYFFDKYLNKEIPHLYYPYYNKFNNYGCNIFQFSIVRNPVDRFMSMFSASLIKDNLNIDTDIILNNKKLLYEYIQKQITTTNYHTNWFLPQYFFINSKCKIWKYENGLGLNFFKWLKKELKISINEKNIFNNYSVEYDDYKKIKINKKTSKYIKEFYKYDYKLLNYK